MVDDPSPGQNPDIEPLIIAAPFGNYIRPAGCTATLGTFTALRRGGRPAAFGRAVLTVRYYRRLQAWVNKIGLRNPGIDWLVESAAAPDSSVTSAVVSVHGFDAGEWDVLLDRIIRLQPAAVELNISCPNVGEMTWPDALFVDAVATEVPVIVKIPPVRYRPMVDQAVAAGVRWIHATNTLPVAKGGMSGAPLKPLALDAVAWLRGEFGADLRIIGGGGIRSSTDIADFAEAGANRFSVGTYAMRPAALRGDAWVAELRTAARRLAT